jgi:hypothetical protein
MGRKIECCDDRYGGALVFRRQVLPIDLSSPSEAKQPAAMVESEYKIHVSRQICLEYSREDK